MLIVEVKKGMFDCRYIKKGALISAKHRSWKRWISGIVTRVLPDILWVQYLPDVDTVKNCFFIPVADLERGEWEIRYSTDGMETISIYPEQPKKDDTSIDIGSIVTFRGGNMCYVFHDGDALGTLVKDSGKVKVVEHIKGKAHPYYVITRNWDTTKANGWTDLDSLSLEDT